ncbi:MAG: hypothetical protein FJW35_14580 [Acidobacteria bacterium]|nr:hypothetical protein [Acidobacteriota bacterium]
MGPVTAMATRKRTAAQKGKLRIGDDWNAITIIAHSQQSPLKALAELVENSIDAHARKVTVTRGRQRGHQYLRIADDGDGIPRNPDGIPDFHYVATHICDSIKRQLRQDQRSGVQGEFGIGLLSFWTLGGELTITSAGNDGRTYEMRMRKGNPRYVIGDRRRLFPERGTEVLVQPLLPGIRSLTGEKIQWYLASELRDRIRRSGVEVQVVDRQARAQYQVVPREFTGRLLHQLPAPESAHGDIYLELYLNNPQPGNRVGLYRHGTRVLEDIAVLDHFQRPPWNAGCLEGIIDAAFLNLTPGTRTGILQDELFAALCTALEPAEQALTEAIEEQRRAEEERASREILRSIQRAFREALLALPAEEYDWFQVPEGREAPKAAAGESGPAADKSDDGAAAGPDDDAPSPQREFFDFPGPLFSVAISPASCTVPVGHDKRLRAIPRDRTRRLVEEALRYRWELPEGAGNIENPEAEIVTYRAPEEPGLTRIRVTVTQGEAECSAEGLITVTDDLMPEILKSPRSRRGLPAYTFHRGPGELWRSRYVEDRNLIVINNAHRDFVYASRSRAMKLRYICRLYIKEMVHSNFPGMASDRLLERMVELSLYTEEHLK